MRIAFLLPPVNRPTGGHAVVMDHVTILREAGFDATVKYDSGAVSYYQKSLPPDALHKEDPIQDPNCILVLPEADVVRYAGKILNCRSLGKTKTVILNQNHFYTFNFDNDIASLQIFRSSSHIATSKTIRRFLQDISPGAEVSLVPVAIETSRFRPKAKIFQIAYMPRKMPEEARAIRTMFLEFAPDLRFVDWIEIDNLSQDEVAAILNHSAIFMSLAKREGFGLPALEAMASGCLVVGFTGSGGDEYATDQNGFWVPDDDIVGLARTLVQVSRDYATSMPYLKAVSQDAIESASVYTRAEMASALKLTWSRIESSDNHRELVGSGNF